MQVKKIVSIVSVFVLGLVLSGCKRCFKKPTRETIFDRVVNIPKELVLNIPYLPPFCDKISSLKKGYVDIKDGKLYYEEEGQGVPIVLINGGPGGTHHLFHPYFSQMKDVARVIYYDQRGTGKSSKDNTGKTYTIKQAVQDLEDLRKALKIDKWVVLGHSYGGLLAQCYALKFPEHCRGLVLSTADPGGKTEVFYTTATCKRAHKFISQAECDAWSNIYKKAKEGKLNPIQVEYNKHLSGYWKMISYHKPNKEDLVKQLLYGFVCAPGFRKIMISEIAKINLKGKFHDFKIPTLVVEGKYDFLWGDMDRVEIMRKNHPNAEIVVFEKSGHNIFADEPDKFFAVLKRFLEKLGSAKSDAKYLTPQFVQDKAQEVLSNMRQCAEKYDDIQPPAISDFSDVKIYQGRRQELFEKPHFLSIGEKRRAAAKNNQIDFPKDTFVDESSLSGITLPTLIHELGHVFYADGRSKSILEHAEKEFRAENLATCVEFEMGLFDATKMDMIAAPPELIPFETKEFRKDKRNFYSLGHLNGLSRYAGTKMYKKLMGVLRAILSKRHDSQKVAAIMKAFSMWKPVSKYQEALKKYDEIAGQVEHLQQS